MAKKMLIDATHPEETRVVVVDGQKVDDFDFESVNKKQLAGNIYLAKVTRVEPSLQAAFVDYGGNRHGFLAFAEIHPDYYQIPVADREALIAEEAAIARESESDEGDGGRARRGRKRGDKRRGDRREGREDGSGDAAAGGEAGAEDDGDAAPAPSGIAGFDVIDTDRGSDPGDDGAAPAASAESVAETPVEAPEASTTENAPDATASEETQAVAPDDDGAPDPGAAQQTAEDAAPAAHAPAAGHDETPATGEDAPGEDAGERDDDTPPRSIAESTGLDDDEDDVVHGDVPPTRRSADADESPGTTDAAAKADDDGAADAEAAATESDGSAVDATGEDAGPLGAEAATLPAGDMPGEDAGAEADTATSTATEVAETPAAAGATPKPRRRSRRRNAETAEDEAATGDAATDQTATDDGAADAAGGEDGDDTASRGRNRRSRRGGRGRGRSRGGEDDAATEAAGEDDAETADAGDAGDAAAESGDDGEDGGRSGRRRSRRRRKGESRRGDREDSRADRDGNTDGDDGDADAGGETEGQDEVDTVGAEDTREEELAARAIRRRRYNIQDVVKSRQIMLVQVVKEERGTKGAALTTYLSLAGRYCVLMPNTARGGGISRKITNATDRKRLREIVGEFEVPEGMGLIVRTAGAERTRAEIKRDYEFLLRQWEQVRSMTLRSTAPCLIYEEGSLIKRAIRDLYNKDIDQVLVEGEGGYREAKDYMKMLMPSHAKNVQQYGETTPLFIRFQVESYLNAMFSPTVQLKSGGYIVIGVTEALVAIDVNSGRSTREGSIEETAVKTNLEAADEVARQLRLRDLAGLIVIDFIDMDENRNNRAVEKRMKDRLKSDRARIQVGRISAFGLMEMSRQRLRPGMLEATTRPCPHCHGQGLIRSDESMALAILREIEEEGVRGRSAEVTARLPVEIANYIVNWKRPHLSQIEGRYGIAVQLVGDPTLVSPDYRIEKSKQAQRAPVTIEAAVTATSVAEEAEIEEAEILESEESAAPEGAAEARGEGESGRDNGDGAARKRRRGKRGGRRRRNGEDEREGGDTRAGGGSDGDDEGDGDAGPSGSGDDDAEGGEGRRGRRRGRGRSRRGEAENDDEAPSGETVPAPAADAVTAPAEPDEAATAGDGAATADMGDGDLPPPPDAAIPAAAPDAMEAPAAPSAPAPEPEPVPEQAAEPEAEPTPEPEPVPEAAAVSAEAPAEPEAARPKRRGWWSLRR